MGTAHRWRLIVVAGVVAALILAGCAGDDEATGSAISPNGDGLGHVHDFALTDDGTLYAATHLGLFKIEDGEAVAVGEDGRHDLMAFAIDTDGTLVASGHPDLSGDLLRVDDLPPLLGLVESTDGGSNWTARSLLGEADFHTLVVTDDRYLAADGTTGRLLVSADGIEWEERGELNGLDLAVDPADGDRMIAATYDSDTQLTIDDGNTWELVDTPEFVAVEWPEAGRLVAAGVDGVIYTSAEPAGPWSELGRVDGVPEALLAPEGDTMWLATRGSGVYRSTDGGRTWDVILAPAPN